MAAADVLPPEVEMENEYPDGEEGEEAEDTTALENAMYADLTMEELKEVFRLFDYEKIGYLSFETFRSILRELDDDWTEDDIETIIEDIDCDHSGSIDFNEFVKIMTY